MGQQSHVSKNHFYIFSAAVQFVLSTLATKLMFHWKAIIILSSLYLCYLLLLHGGVGSNPGLRNSKNNLQSFFHWNFNSLPEHNFAKMLLLKAYNALNKLG